MVYNKYHSIFTFLTLEILISELISLSLHSVNIKYNMEQIIKHFTDNDAYTFTCQYYILKTYPRAEVEYKFFDRNHTKYPKGFADLLQE